MYLITTILVVGINSHNNQSVLYEKPVQQLERHSLVTFYIVTKDGIMIFDDPVIRGDFMLRYTWFMTRSCMLQKKPSIGRYRSRKGYLT